MKPETKRRLALLLPLLGSDQSGEVVATASRITALLKSEKLDWHDLSKLLCNAPETKAPPSSQGRYRDSDFTDDDFEPEWRWSKNGNRYMNTEMHSYIIIPPERYVEWSIVIINFSTKRKSYMNNFKSERAAMQWVEENRI